MRALLAVFVALVAACDADRPVVPIEGDRYGEICRPSRPPLRLDKLDLLFVIDNSPGMADEQAELARRIPAMIAALTDPTADPRTGSTRSFVDVHVGVISSSLGSYGTSVCAPSRTNARNDDRAHLLPRAGEAACAGARPGEPISWVRDPTRDPTAQHHGQEGVKALAEATSCAIASAKDDGCVHPAPWEAAYRFLVDPAPYLKAEASCTFGDDGDTCGTNRIEVTGLDEEILKQRAAFLRPDSALAVVIVSHENDASLKPAGLNWIPWGFAQGSMKRGFTGCTNVPDDFEPETSADFARLHDDYACFSCFERVDDPHCDVPWPADPVDADVDARSLRAFQQVQRFGYNFLYGRQRYVDAFSKPTLSHADGSTFENPVFKGGVRGPSDVVLATFVGVAPELLTRPDGARKNELAPEDWARIAGPIGARDPRMIESIAGDTLQAACSAERPEQRSPSKALPGLRHLRIARDLGDSGFVASVCSANFGPALAGLAERLTAIAGVSCTGMLLPANDDGATSCRLYEVLRADANVARCEDLGRGVCTPGSAPCRAPGSEDPPVDPATAASTMATWVARTNDDGTTTRECTDPRAATGNVYAVTSDGTRHLVCERMQLAGGRVPASITAACIGDPSWAPDDVSGWCWSTSPAIVGEACRKRGWPGTLRYVGAAEPRPGSTIVVSCAR